MNTHPIKPNSGKTPNRRAILRRRVLGAIGAASLLGAGGIVAQGIASGAANTSKLMGQLGHSHKSGRELLEEDIRGEIDGKAVVVIQTPHSQKPILAWEEAAKLESDQNNIEPLAGIIADEMGGQTVGPDAILVLPKDLIKPPGQLKL